MGTIRNRSARNEIDFLFNDGFSYVRRSTIDILFNKEGRARALVWMPHYFKKDQVVEANVRVPSELLLLLFSHIN